MYLFTKKTKNEPESMPHIPGQFYTRYKFYLRILPQNMDIPLAEDKKEVFECISIGLVDAINQLINHIKEYYPLQLTAVEYMDTELTTTPVSSHVIYDD